MRILRLANVLSLLIGAASWAAPCPQPTITQVLDQSATGLSVQWQYADDESALFARADILSFTKLKIFHDQIRAKTSLDARGLIEHQKKFIQLSQSTMNPDLAAEFDHHLSTIVDPILNGTGVIEDVNCLEAQAFEEMLKVVDLFADPQELVVVGLRKGPEWIIVGSFYKSGWGSSNFSGAAQFRIDLLLARGWVNAFHLHSHPFFSQVNDWQDSRSQIGGQIEPSGVDLELYRRLKPEKAAISNGLQTLYLNREEQERLGR